jgi:pimeloyl-ACP methyl ester carboxylesterase
MAWTSRLFSGLVYILLGNAHAVVAAPVTDTPKALHPPAITSHHATIDGHHLHFVVKQGLGKTPILFIHGSPGDWQAWRFYLDSPQLADFGDRIAVDRPGFGLSEPSHVMPELRQQAQLLAKLLPKNQQTIVVGHSLGAPIAVWLGLDHPELVCAVVSIAGSLSAERETPRWYNTLASWRVFQPFIPQDMLDSNQEMMPLSQQLQLLAAALPQLKKPIVLLQGQDDALVAPETVGDMEKLLPSALLRINRIANQGHFVIWKKPDVLINALRTMSCPSL